MTKLNRDMGAVFLIAWMTGFASPGANAEAERLNVLGIEITIKTDGQKTGGAMALVEAVVPPGGGPPLHIHSREDELFYVLEGKFKFWHGETEMVLDAGDSTFLHRNGRHTYQNVGATPGRLLTVISPAGFEDFFREVSKRRLSAPKDMNELNALASTYGLNLSARRLAHKKLDDTSLHQSYCNTDLAISKETSMSS